MDPRKGSDELDGRFPHAAAHGRGPVATLEKARDQAYADASARKDDRPVYVWLRSGTYSRTEPLTLGPRQGNVEIRFLAHPGDDPVISGGREITGWTATTINGVAAWRTIVPEVANGSWVFRQLFVNGKARPLPRLPKTVNRIFEDGQNVGDVTESFYMTVPNKASGASGPDYRNFIYRPGDIDPNWSALTDIEVVTFWHWVAERDPIQSVDGANDTCTLAFRASGKRLGARYYYVENVKEALTEPGEWYLDRATGEVFYIPKPGEDPSGVTITAPATERLLLVQGTSTQPVQNITFQDLTFTQSARRVIPTIGQSAAQTQGTIGFTYAQNCEIADCTVTGTGEYGIEIGAGCHAVSIVGCDIRQTGAGGIKIDSSTDTVSNGGHTVTDNEIHDTGKIFQQGVGILAMDSPSNTIAHNHIHDLYYTGISLGWVWGFRPNHIHDDLVAYNHIHDVGRGLLTDLGGVYTLGIQPNTVVRNNYIHDVTGQPGSPTAGMYGDSGTTHISWNDNVVHGANPAFFLNRGADNQVTNNLLLAGAGTGVARARNLRGDQGPNSFTLKHNAIVIDRSQATDNGADFEIAAPHLVSDNNVWWNTGGEMDDIDLAGPQEMRIVRGDTYLDVPGSHVDVDLSAAQPGTFAFGALDAPITLEAGTRYFIVTSVEFGPRSASWYSPVPVDTTGDASLFGPVFGNASPHYTPHAGTGSFGPVTFSYKLGTSGEQSDFVTAVHTSGGIVRRNYGGLVGLAVDIGPAPLTVTRLGRYRPAVTCWDQWREAGLDQHSAIVHRELPESYELQPDSPALQALGSIQPIDLSSVGPRKTARRHTSR